MLDLLLSKKIMGPVITIIVSFVMYEIFKKLIIKKIIKSIQEKDDKRAKMLILLFNNLVKYFIIIIAILIILSIYGINTAGLITSLGVVGVVAGLALQDTLRDFLSGVSIITEKQYTIGDTVTINGFKGEVLSLGIKTTKLRSIDGDIKFIANRNITEVLNHSIDFSLAIIEVSIDYNENIDKVEKILNNLFLNLNKEIQGIKKDIQLLGIEELGNSAIIFKITVETEPLKNYEIQRTLRKEIKQELDRHNIKIPYNQLVIHNE